MELVMNVNDISKCYQCGTCTGDCPVAWVNRDFNPRKIVLTLQTDGKDLNADVFWMCSVCYKCLRCPRDVKPVEVFSSFRRMAISNGHDGKGVKMYRAFVETVKEYGRLVEFKFTVKYMGKDALKLLPAKVAFKMWRSGKVSISAKKSECADEVRRLFEVCAHA